MATFKKYVHQESKGELFVQDEVQEAALINEGFVFKELCDEKGKKVEEDKQK